MEVESEICIQCWTLQTQMRGLAFSCTEMLHDRDYLLIVSLPLLFLPHTHTHISIKPHLVHTPDLPCGEHGVHLLHKLQQWEV